MQKQKNQNLKTNANPQADTDKETKTNANSQADKETSTKKEARVRNSYELYVVIFRDWDYFVGNVERLYEDDVKVSFRGCFLIQNDYQVFIDVRDIFCSVKIKDLAWAQYPADQLLGNLQNLAREQNVKLPVELKNQMFVYPPGEYEVNANTEEAQPKTNWERFFHPGTLFSFWESVQKKKARLDDGINSATRSAARAATKLGRAAQQAHDERLRRRTPNVKISCAPRSVRSYRNGELPPEEKVDGGGDSGGDSGGGGDSGRDSGGTKERKPPPSPNNRQKRQQKLLDNRGDGSGYSYDINGPGSSKGGGRGQPDEKKRIDEKKAREARVARREAIREELKKRYLIDDMSLKKKKTELFSGTFKQFVC